MHNACKPDRRGRGCGQGMPVCGDRVLYPHAINGMIGIGCACGVRAEFGVVAPRKYYFSKSTVYQHTCTPRGHWRGSQAACARLVRPPSSKGHSMSEACPP
eukprot:scaffold7149_cov54-Phaeocystis_antarctica.AAC.5